MDYLKEIDVQVHRMDDKIKFWGYQVRLTQRLLNLDYKTVDDLQLKLEIGRQAVKLKKAKYHLKG